jgi:hypothetical protein
MNQTTSLLLAILGNNGALRGSPFSLALPLWRHGSFIGTTSKPPIFRLEMCEVPHRVAWLTAATIGIASDKRGGSTMKYLLSILIIAVVASQAMIWQSLVSIREAIQQGNAIIVAACGSDERPCQVAARRGQVELGEIMVPTRITDGFSCGYSRFNPCWTKPSAEDEVTP